MATSECLRWRAAAAVLVAVLGALACGCRGSSAGAETARTEPPAPVSAAGRLEQPPARAARSLDLPAPVAASEPAVSQEVPSDAPAARSVDESAWRTADSSAGGYELRWRPVGGDVPRNLEFELEVELARGGEPLAGEWLYVRGWMPDHAHGLVREPTVSDLGGGRYRVTNLLLHMRGLWQLVFDVGEGAERDTIVFEIEL